MTANETDARTRIDVDVGVGAALSDFAPPAERIPVNDRLLSDARAVGDRVLRLRAARALNQARFGLVRAVDRAGTDPVSGSRFEHEIEGRFGGAPETREAAKPQTLGSSPAFRRRSSLTRAICCCSMVWTMIFYATAQ